jgi:hypothetical protein
LDESRLWAINKNTGFGARFFSGLVIISNVTIFFLIQLEAMTMTRNDKKNILNKTPLTPTHSKKNPINPGEHYLSD